MEPVFEYRTFQNTAHEVTEDIDKSAAEGWIVQTCTTTLMNGQLWWSVLMYKDVSDDVGA